MHRVSLHSTGAVEVTLLASLKRLSRDLPLEPSRLLPDASPLKAWRVTSTALKIHGDRRNVFVACPQLGSVGSGNSC
jgi:hypothetical protein